MSRQVQTRKSSRARLSWWIFMGGVAISSGFSTGGVVPAGGLKKPASVTKHLSSQRRQSTFCMIPGRRQKRRGFSFSSSPQVVDTAQKEDTKQTGLREQVNRLFLSSTNAYLDYLDNISGKGYYTYFTQRTPPPIPIVNGSVDVEIEPNSKETAQNMVEKSGGFLEKIVSPRFIDDIRRRREHYMSDWTDAFKKPQQVIPAILFLYFACLSPAISFGTIASQITNRSIGIVEFLLSCGLSGMAYAILAGQPMAFIAPTGLTLAFISGLFRFCTLKALPFFPVYAWVGLWTSAFMVMLGLAGSSQMIRYCTRFTDEIFNGLLSLNFIYEASSSLQRNFVLADPMNLTMPFVSLAMAWTTFWSTMVVANFDRSKFFNAKVRKVIKDFGPITIVALLTILNHNPWFMKFGIPTLIVPDAFELSGGRKFLVDLNAIPFGVRMLCSLPAVLLTSLFYMDQNISVRIANNPENKLKKGAAYNLDMVALGLITGALSVVGLPWMCGATVQSMNHVRAMTETEFNEKKEELEIVEVTETRTTGFLIHAMIAGTLGLLPLLQTVPIPVVSGVFLFLGRKLMSGNSFLQRVRDCFSETKRLPESHPIRMIGRRKASLFTIIQVACLLGLWAFKQNSATAIFFPSVIGMLMLIRSFILPRIFNEWELVQLGEPLSYSPP